MKDVVIRLIRGIGKCLLALLLILPVVSCNSGVPVKEKTIIAVSILPQAEFAENLGGSKVDITVMVPPGADPHQYEPLASQMAKLSHAVVYAKVGAGMEFELGWMDKFSAINKEMLLVDCSRGITLLRETESEADNGQQHAESGTDPHIWMSPRNAEIMVKNMCDGLVQVDPVNRLFYETNRDTYTEKLRQLDRDIETGLSGIENRCIMTFHPSFDYLARDYNLNIITIAAEGKEPTAAGIAKLIEQARKNNVKAIFVSPQFNMQSASVIASEIKGKVIVVDPLSKDYSINMRKILKDLVEVLR